MITVISKLLIPVSLTHIHFAFISWIHFVPYLSTFTEFSFQSNKHSKNLYLIFRNKSLHNQFYMWIVTSLKSTTK